MQLFPKKPILVTVRFVFVAGDGEWKDWTPREAWNLMMLEVDLTFESKPLPKWGKITTFKESCSFKFQQNPLQEKTPKHQATPLTGPNGSVSHFFDENARMGFNWGSVIHGVRMLQEPGKADGARTSAWDVDTTLKHCGGLRGVDWCEGYL